ncbi:MAG: choice-of-anchor I family protein, partial [Xanthomonadales bacterium]|jgi:hypothetical protein|nr:choice-of-anchor I family protein [Xanthomonadales bacterium]
VGVAVENDDKQADGWAAFYTRSGRFLGSAPAGALPDAITFTPDGRYALLANEGEPSDDYQVDPEGSVTVIDLLRGVKRARVRQADFRAFNDQPLPDGLRAPRPFGATIAQDLEPEFIGVSPDSRTAYVSLQENNGVAVVDIRRATITGLLGLGAKDHSRPGNALDASNRDDAINIQNWPVNGLYMPDTINAFRTRGETYLITANEGDGREYLYEIEEGATQADVEDCEALINAAGGFNAGEADFDDQDTPDPADDALECIVYLDEIRIKDMTLDGTAFPDAATLQEDENLGRLKAVGTEGDENEDGEWETLFNYGARSFTIWNTRGEVVYDSGDIMEYVTAMASPANFNSTNDENDSFDDRSDDKGPEPESAIVGKAFGRQWAFVGLERVGGIMVFDVTRPADTRYVTYINNRDFGADDILEAGDLGPEGLYFIRASESPIREPLLVVGNEVSGTTTIYRVFRD